MFDLGQLFFRKNADTNMFVYMSRVLRISSDAQDKLFISFEQYFTAFELDIGYSKGLLGFLL